MTYRFPTFKGVYLSTRRGFTLIEVLVAMFIFTLMMASVAQIFSTTFLGYHNMRAVQRDIDNAQYSLNILAKELRTSSIVNFTSSSVKFFDHSQGKCFQYQINGNNLQVTSAGASDTAACTATSLSSPTTISTGLITGTFRVTPSTVSPPHVGKVTVSIDISEGSAHHARIQTSVSLRDFSVSGL